MKVLLVTSVRTLEKKFTVLNPELEYCAVVVDKVGVAKAVLKRLGLSKVPVHSMSALKICAEEFSYDYLLCAQDFLSRNEAMTELQTYTFPKDKVLSFFGLQATYNFTLEQKLRYCREHSAEIEIFATGISHTAHALDIRQFKRRLINLATPSQDLYYDFQIAKNVVLYGEGHNTIRYALIGLTPYSFHYDLSRAFVGRCLLLQYFIAFNDLHNFCIPADIYKKFLREEWLNTKLDLSTLDLNEQYCLQYTSSLDPKTITPDFIKAIRNRTWNEKFYPKTRDENVKILDEYLVLCEENNVRPIILMTPVTEAYREHFDKNLMEEFYVLIERALQKHPGVLFVDGWKWNGVTYADFRDVEHLNLKGAIKFSSYLNDFIERLDKERG